MIFLIALNYLVGMWSLKCSFREEHDGWSNYFFVCFILNIAIGTINLIYTLAV